MGIITALISELPERLNKTMNLVGFSLVLGTVGTMDCQKKEKIHLGGRNTGGLSWGKWDMSWDLKK